MNDPMPLNRDPAIDPGIAAAIARAAALGARKRDLTDIPGARAQLRREQTWWAENPPAVAELRDDALQLGERAAAIRLYRPRPDVRSPVILFLHGGGWCLGDLDTHANVARGLAIAADAVVVALDYALAPEAPFPQCFDETVAAARALRGEAGERLGIDATKLALAGDSAGANLSLAAAVALRDAGTPADALGLFYGSFDTGLDTASFRRFGDGRFGLSRAEMAQFFDYYIPPTARRDDPRITPLHADLRGLPPAYVLACGLDVLRDDSVRLAGALAEAGVRFRLDLLPGATHGFLRYGNAVPLATRALDAAGAFLRQALTAVEPDHSAASRKGATSGTG
ncbi:MAG TPA: alpha/beta hydrolase fold domain-containing protein [Xanthobacteraceae bacterium]|nr:alpha/beta hydrolase fold domain-containing protein [Xanthobacteraceae bacterium]